MVIAVNFLHYKTALRFEFKSDEYYTQREF